MIIFLDLETMGLVPHRSCILELAAAVVDSQLNPVSGFTSVVALPAGANIPIDPYVHQMHTKNGLLDEAAGAPTLAEVERGFLEWLPAGEHTLAGCSVHFDLAFLREHMPAVAARFSHQILDISAFAVAREFSGLPPCPITAGENHRAPGDVLAAIAKARWHLSRLVP